ncbi:MAG: NADH-quinone oxidoreductase subunit J [Candidatus Latescibacteria bacterium]|nr:NADH-quinone oxidoreductase subunit J [Candidatus Latescibacterota bacterium]NIM66391.1 NADH-quinone oxidoreductase subunit J [Candidatus Latescibacterota bacterium]NIO02870.1 NADH-quinone oxidoreductase subunit J [Candidatus Latescibacterota bacterium]NIO30005.1 NADH-quinone oxidoreductase subunit J [Candidatus Latescibacterota bacterium]NIO57620.1 NADH-quinone oxidoreductase subunit J [Candidatus Latescibacterota bacterium]
MGEIVFIALAVGTTVGAGVVAFSKNIVYSAFALLLSFFCVAGLYVFLAADFVAATQVIVYIGGILVLILFGVMLTEKIEKVNISNQALKPFRAWILLIVSGGILIAAIVKTNWITKAPLPPTPTTGELGNAFLTRYLLPFEIASVLLLVALIGAIIAGRKEVRRK